MRRSLPGVKLPQDWHHVMTDALAGQVQVLIAGIHQDWQVQRLANPCGF